MTRILVVEDDWAILHGLKDNLEQDSHEVLTATDGETGHALIQSEKPDPQLGQRAGTPAPRYVRRATTRTSR